MGSCHKVTTTTNTNSKSIHCIIASKTPTAKKPVCKKEGNDVGAATYSEDVQVTVPTATTTTGSITTTK